MRLRTELDGRVLEHGRFLEVRAFDDGGREEGYQDDGVCGEEEAGEMGDGVRMVQEPVQTHNSIAD